MGKGIDVLMAMEGGAELRRALKKHEAEFLREMAEALPNEAQQLMAAANSLAPRASGALASSASVSSVVQEKRGRVRAVAAYTDEKAAAVHEGVHWGERIEGTRGFKWLERALNAFEGGFAQRIAERLKRLVGGGS
jgi:hypothetical protein